MVLTTKPTSSIDRTRIQDRRLLETMGYIGALGKELGLDLSFLKRQQLSKITSNILIMTVWSISGILARPFA